MYHPNLEQIIRTARALFADDSTPLDERVILDERTLNDASGASWRIQAPTFADGRIAALLEAHREAEMAQAALRGRPLEHPDAQITILSSLPLPGLSPTIICAATATPHSNAGRERATIDRLLTVVARPILPAVDLLRRLAHCYMQATSYSIITDSYRCRLQLQRFVQCFLHEAFDRLLAPEPKRAAAEAAGEALDSSKPDPQDLVRVAVEHAHPGVCQNLAHLVRLSGLIIMIAQHRS